LPGIDAIEINKRVERMNAAEAVSRIVSMADKL
jgi:hypothetical protein